MSKTYYSVLTTYGAQLFAQAMTNRQQVRITQFAVGDGGGRAVQPDSTRTSLVRQVHRANVSVVSLDPRNNRQVIFELTLPEDVGGFWIREMGIYDAQNRLVAYANCPDTYKPRLTEGSGKVQVMRMILLVSSSNAVTLTVDDSVIFATRGQLTPKSITATSQNGIDDTGHSHQIDQASTSQAGIVQLSSATNSNSETQAATLKAVKTVKDLADGKVGKAGNEEIEGVKTFNNEMRAVGQMRISDNKTLHAQYHYMTVGANDRDAWFNFRGGGILRIHKGDRLSFNNHTVYHAGNTPRATDTGLGFTQLSHETNGTDRTKAASEYALGEVRRMANQAQVTADGIALTWDNVHNKPTTFPPSSHGHNWNEISGKPAAFPPSSHRHSWGEIDGKPATFPPSSHGHNWNEINGKPSASTQQAGIVQLSSATNSNSETQAATLKAVKTVKDLTDGKVGKSGNETINGEKTFNSRLAAVGTLRIAASAGDHNGGHYATFGANTRDAWWVLQGGGTLRIHKGERLSFNNRDIYHTGNLPRSHRIDSTSETDLATSKAVKTLNDNKAELNHTHRVSEISDFAQSVASQFSYRKIGDFEIRKFPDGTMIQTYRVRINNQNTGQWNLSFDWAESFRQPPHVIAMLSGSTTEVGYVENTDTYIMYNRSLSTASRCVYHTHEYKWHGTPINAEFTALGRWK